MLTEYEKRTISRYYEKEGHRIGMEKGLAEGRAKGMEEGRAKGMAEGRAEGRAEERKQLTEALRNLGVPEDVLAKAMEQVAKE